MLIFDSHVTHAKSLAATEMAREAGVCTVSLLPHTAHRLWDSDVVCFGPLGKYYEGALRTWMREHVDRPVTTWQVAKILNAAYRKVASDQNVVICFRTAGIWSLTRYVFQDSDIAAATVTKVITEAAQEHNPTPPLTPAVANPALTAVIVVTVQEHNHTSPYVTPVVSAPH